MAEPSAAFGARLNETVAAGNCPWWVIESGWVVVWTLANALSGTALDSWVTLGVFGPRGNRSRCWERSKGRWLPAQHAFRCRRRKERRCGQSIRARSRRARVREAIYRGLAAGPDGGASL